jgi:hypothetical protein
MKIIIFISTGILLLISCQTKQNTLAQFDWLQGSWENIGAAVEYYEIWEKDNDSLFTGIGFVMQDGDTIFQENIILIQKQDGIYYIPTVSGQNNEEPVSFKLVSDSAGIRIFENMGHDFPQRIGYSNPKPDSLYAYIEGNYKGKYRKEEFPLTRKK